MRWGLRRIEESAPRTYRATLRNGDVERSFSFHVELRGEIELVTWDRDFDELVGLQQSGGEPLLAAIQAFHKARELVFGG